MATRAHVQTWKGQLRLPQPIADWLRERADANFRSLNAEIVEQIRQAMERQRANPSRGA